MQELTLSTGTTVNVAPVPGIELQAIQVRIEDPPIPREYIASQDRWIEYPGDADHIEALQEASVQRSILAQRHLLRNAIKLIDSIDERDLTLLRKSIERGIVHADWAELDNEDDMRVLYIEHIVIGSREDYTRLAEAACITEIGVSRHFDMLKVTRDNEPIESVSPKHAVYAGIQNATLAIGETLLVHPCDQYDACVGSNLDWYLWNQQTYEKEFMLITIALYRARILKNIHGQDAAQDKSVKASKKNQG